MVNKVVYCTTDPRLRGPGTDHVPILTVLELPAKRADRTPRYNFRVVEWEDFKKELATRMEELPEPGPIRSEEEYEAAVSGLTRVLQETIHAMVPVTRPSPHSKRWWSKELDILKKKKNKLSSTSYKYRALTGHPSHEEHRRIRREYSSTIVTAKRDHWTLSLEGLSYGDVWMANHYISGDGLDGGRTQIPTLMLHPHAAGGEAMVASTNEEKSRMLMKLMFPNKPEGCQSPDESYDNQLPSSDEIVEGQI